MDSDDDIPDLALGGHKLWSEYTQYDFGDDDDLCLDLALEADLEAMRERDEKNKKRAQLKKDAAKLCDREVNLLTKFSGKKHPNYARSEVEIGG